jgi:hypothetical protein
MLHAMLHSYPNRNCTVAAVELAADRLTYHSMHSKTSAALLQHASHAHVALLSLPYQLPLSCSAEESCCKDASPYAGL